MSRFELITKCLGEDTLKKINESKVICYSLWHSFTYYVFCFSGHFHQNLVSETSFGMKMIVTGPLSAMLESTGKIEKKAQRHAEGLVLDEPDTLGVRLVEVLDDGSFRHEFISIVEGEKCKWISNYTIWFGSHKKLPCDFICM